MFVSSINATHGTPGLSAYSAAKAGLNGFMTGVAIEVGCHGILVNAVSPGYVLSPGLLAWASPSEGGAADADLNALFPDSKRIIPLGRLAHPIEIAGTILFLASDETSYIHAQAIMVDGGQSKAENQMGLWPEGAP